MSCEKVLKFKKSAPRASSPVRGSRFAAGIDLKSAQDVTIEARGRALISTGLNIKLPECTFGRISPRSGLALNAGIDVGAGILDEDYRGIVYVLLFNHSEKNYTVKVGDKVAQLIVCPYISPMLEEVQILDETKRGEGGFGSTGV